MVGLLVGVEASQTAIDVASVLACIHAGILRILSMAVNAMEGSRRQDFRLSNRFPSQRRPIESVPWGSCQRVSCGMHAKSVVRTDDERYHSPQLLPYCTCKQKQRNTPPPLLYSTNLFL